MPQLSLYIDEETLAEIRTAAKTEKISVSKYVTGKLRDSLHESWPEHYDELFGSIEDDTFTLKRAAEFRDDTSRETL